jgi:2-polyprenyl-3-methyl-5-hydroxy-6-metoxy-1,4-benzoquinol methylase
MPGWGDGGGLRSLAARTWSGHRLFVVVLAPAVLLRVDAELGYQWQAWFNDSFEYVSNTIHFGLDPTRVSGYSVGLKILQPFHSYALITVLQHLMGLAIAVMIYALARHRFGAPAWLATLATVPVLYDGFEIELEHLIMADVPFLFLIMLATTLLLWDRSGPSLRTCVAVGLLVGIAGCVRSVALPLLPVFAVYMIIRGFGWRKVVATIGACVVPVFGYAAVFDLEHGQFAMGDASGVFLYARVMTFAECPKMHVPADELWLCTVVPPDKRPIAQEYIWSSASPLDRLTPTKFSPLPDKLAQDFAIRAIEAQPVDYARAVFDDTWRVFAWKRYVFPNAQTYDEYLFGYKGTPIPSWDRARLGKYDSFAAAYVQGNPNTHVVEPFARIIRIYQRYVWLPGTVYGLILLAGLGGIVLAWRRLGGEALLPWAISLAMVVVPAATAEFDYRYVLAATPFGCLAAAIAFSPGSAGGRLVRELAAQARKHQRAAPDEHMTWLDRYLQKWRIRKARRELPPGARVLDIGTHDGTLFRLTRARGVGIDPELAAVTSIPGVTLVKGSFPKDLPKLPTEPFDAVTALAVVEHVPESELLTWAETIARLVAPNGLLIITVPAPTVDAILHVLMRLHLVAGIEAHQHHGFKVSNLDHIFTAPLWRQAKHRTFQLRLNHLYVFERAPHLHAQNPRLRRHPPANRQGS